jgi:hypothetical protein
MVPDPIGRFEWILYHPGFPRLARQPGKVAFRSFHVFLAAMAYRHRRTHV